MYVSQDTCFSLLELRTICTSVFSTGVLEKCGQSRASCERSTAHYSNAPRTPSLYYTHCPITAMNIELYPAYANHSGVHSMKSSPLPAIVDLTLCLSYAYRVFSLFSLFFSESLMTWLCRLSIVCLWLYITLHHITQRFIYSGLSKENFKQPLWRNNNVRVWSLKQIRLQFTTKHWQRRGRWHVMSFGKLFHSVRPTVENERSPLLWIDEVMW